MIPRTETEPQSAGLELCPVAAERHWSPSEVAAIWSLDVETIRRIFQNEPGVIVLQKPVAKGKRGYRTIRIPQTVLDRVHKRLQR